MNITFISYRTANATLSPSRTNNRNSRSGYDLSPKCRGNEGSIALCPFEHEWGSQFCGDDLDIECTPTPIGKHQENMSVKCIPLEPHFYIGKLGYGGYTYFS